MHLPFVGACVTLLIVATSAENSSTYSESIALMVWNTNVTTPSPVNTSTNTLQNKGVNVTTQSLTATTTTPHAGEPDANVTTSTPANASTPTQDILLKMPMPPPNLKPAVRTTLV